MKRIVLDIDGCFAEFNQGFRALLIQRGAKIRAFEVPEGPSCWSWPQVYGATYAEETSAWKYVYTHPEWWGTLEPHRDLTHRVQDIVNDLAIRHDLFFVTSRPMEARESTSGWLDEHVCAFGTLICCDGKVEILRGLTPAAIMEDKPETLLGFRRPGEGVLVRRPWNTHVTEASTGLTIVNSTERALERILEVVGG